MDGQPTCLQAAGLRGSTARARSQMAFFAVAAQLASALSYSDSMYIGAGAGVVLALLVPACGYFGAKERNTTLLQCFWCCNACGACVYVRPAASCHRARHSG